MTLKAHLDFFWNKENPAINEPIFGECFRLVRQRREFTAWRPLVAHILNTPNLGSPIGAFKAALKLSPRTVRVSTGSITPSSHNLADEK